MRREVLKIHRSLRLDPALFKAAEARGYMRRRDGACRALGQAILDAARGEPWPELAHLIRGPVPLHRSQGRPRIPDAIRRAVYERDGHRCVLCGAAENLSLDHVQFWSEGGADTPENLRTLCMPCNVRRQPKRRRREDA